MFDMKQQVQECLLVKLDVDITDVDRLGILLREKPS